MKDLDRIEKLFRLLGSENDNEAATALRMIKAALAKQNENFSGFANYLFGGQARSQRREEPREERQQYQHRQQRQQQHSQDYNSGDKVYYHPTESFNGTTYLEMGAVLQKITTLNDWEKSFTKDVYNKRLVLGIYITVKQRNALIRIFNTYINQQETA